MSHPFQPEPVRVLCFAWPNPPSSNEKRSNSMHLPFTFKSLRPLMSVSLLAMSLATSGCAMKPEPLAEQDFAAYAGDKFERLTLDQEPVHGSIDLYEAMARALKYNLDYKVEMMQTALKIRELDLSTYKMLPNFVANSGYTARNNVAASTSQSVLTGKQSLEVSTSQDRHNFASDLTLSWNVLDFGLSYVRAKQAGDEALIANEMRRKVVNRVIEDVRTAYWRALASEHLVARLRGLEGRVRSAMAESRKLFNDRQTSPVAALTYERELIEIKRELQRMEGELKSAHAQLAALMNVDPGKRFRLARAPVVMPSSGLTPERMIRTAIENRAELREVAYRSRINEKEATAALLELLPGVNLYAGGSADTNSFLYNNSWVGWGAKASWNLMRVFQYPATKDRIEAQDQLLDQKALAVTMAVMTQVHVARARHIHSKRELGTSQEYLNVQRRLIGQMRAQAVTDKLSQQTLVREEMNLLVAEVRHDMALANAENTYANLFASMGVDPLRAGLDLNTDVATLSKSLRQAWSTRGTITGMQHVAQN